MDKKNYIDKVIKFLTTKEGLYYMGTAEFLLETLTNEYYIIFYYMIELSKRNIRLTEQFIQTGMEAHKMDWINPRSTFMRDSPQITKEYLQSKTNLRLEYDMDYANALEELTIERFKSIDRSDTMEIKEFQEIINQLRDIASMVFAKKVSQEVQPLIMGEKEFIYYEGIRYSKTDSLQYMVNRAQRLNYSLSVSNDNSQNKYQVWDRMSRNSVGLVPAYIWNIGKNIFSNPHPGYVVSVIAPPKVGKTRFCVGEIVYPALLLGRNVKYFSGEIEEHIIRGMLLTKHIKYTKGYKIIESTVQKVMVTAARIRMKKATHTELRYFEQMPGNIKEAVFQAENDLFYSGKYGNLGVVSIGDIGTDDSNIVPSEFIVEKQHHLLRKENERMEDKDRWNVIVQDHVNHMRSEKGLKDAAMIETYIQSAKAYASSEETKCVYVIVNHLNTEQEKKIEEQDSAEGIKLRGHGSNESGKSADVEFIMYETSLDKKEGTVHICITADRYKKISEIYKTDTFIMKADRGNCDFSFEGVGVKPPYPTVEQLGQIEGAMMAQH